MKSPHIVVVDDEPQVLKLFGLSLTKAGYTVTLKNSGVGLLGALRDSGADLLVLDLSMPEPDGFELLKIMRTALPQLPIVVVSGYVGGSLLKAAEMLGAAATVPKHDGAAKLVEIVRSTLQRFPPTPTQA